MAALVGAMACADSSSSAPSLAAQAGPSGDTRVVAEVGDQKITLADVDQRALMADAGSYGGMKLMHALYEARRQAIDGIVADRLFELEAKAQGVTTDALIKQEVLSRMAPVQEPEIQAWYSQNPGRVRGAPIDQVREPIRQLLQQERQQGAFNALVERLKKKVPVRVTLEAPRQNVTVAANDPTAGPAEAPVQIVEFSDFQ
jgi:hypothetical protein